MMPTAYTCARSGLGRGADGGSEVGCLRLPQVRDATDGVRSTDIGEIERVIEIEPVVLPVPEVLPVPSPSGEPTPKPAPVRIGA
jgi:hypothetical protein